MDLPKELRLTVYPYAVDVDLYKPPNRPRGTYKKRNGSTAPYHPSSSGTAHLKSIQDLSYPDYSEAFSRPCSVIVLLQVICSFGFSARSKNREAFERMERAVRRIAERDGLEWESVRGKTGEETVAMVEGWEDIEVAPLTEGEAE